jgi:hypothetical protein
MLHLVGFLNEAKTELRPILFLVALEVVGDLGEGDLGEGDLSEGDLSEVSDESLYVLR